MERLFALVVCLIGFAAPASGQEPCPCPEKNEPPPPALTGGVGLDKPQLDTLKKTDRSLIAAIGYKF